MRFRLLCLGWAVAAIACLACGSGDPSGTEESRQPTLEEFLESVEPYCGLFQPCIGGDGELCIEVLSRRYDTIDASDNCEVQPVEDYYSCLGTISCSEFIEIERMQNPNPADNACNDELVATMGCL